MNEGYEEDKGEKQKLIEENNLLRIFAALGLVIGEFVHEIKNYLPGFEAEINYIKRLLDNDEIAIKRVLRLDDNMKAFTSYASFFDKTISRGVQREVENINVKERIRTFCETIERNRKKANIEIITNLDEPRIILSNILTIPMHPSEWASILFNLYTNAKKAIKKQNVDGQIGIICGQEQSNVFIEFSDNGTGVDPIVKDTMFEAFVTTTPVAPCGSDDIDTYTGTGLGLKIVRDIISSYNGNIFLKPIPNEGYKTTFRIEIPKKND